MDASGTVYIEAIFCIFMVALTTLCMPETYAPIILARKAKKMRKNENDPRYWHPHERDKITVGTLFTKHLSRPIRYSTPPLPHVSLASLCRTATCQSLLVYR